MISTGTDTVLGNAKIILADRVIERGWIAFATGRIAEFGEGNAPAGSEDAGGDRCQCDGSDQAAPQRFGVAANTPSKRDQPAPQHQPQRAWFRRRSNRHTRIGRRAAIVRRRGSQPQGTNPTRYRSSGR